MVKTKEKFFPMPYSVLNSTQLTLMEKCLLCYIVEKYGYGFREISVRRICEELGIKSNNTIIKSRNRLKELGLLDFESVTVRNFQVSRYHINIENINKFFGAEIYTNDQKNSEGKDWSYVITEKFMDEITFLAQHYGYDEESKCEEIIRKILKGTVMNKKEREEFDSILEGYKENNKNN